MHAIIVRGAPDVAVPGSLGAFFRNNAYIIGGHRLSLDEIEHGILRGNKVCVSLCNPVSLTVALCRWCTVCVCGGGG